MTKSDAIAQPESERRRLAAVVFTDVVGYAARMQRDESDTLAAVNADSRRMRECCAEQGGEVLNSMGDGLMLCFPSAAQAVTFALKVQEEFSARATGDPRRNALVHRLGVHLGDVIFQEDGSIAGDGVNIASRLEAKASPGGICISQAVYDTVKGKVPMQARFAGPLKLKNIAEPILAWQVLPAGAAFAGATEPWWRGRRALITAISIAVVAVAGTWLWSRRDAPPAPFAGKVASAMADSQSIAVLPFTNMSDNKENAYFADGVHEELLTQLARLAELKVVSRTSVMDYRDSKKNMRQIGAELGARTLVEGSVRRAGNSVRVTAQLIDAATDKHLWAASYDRELKDIFSIQSELAHEIVAALKLNLSPQQMALLGRRPTDNLAAYELFLRYQTMINSDTGTYRIAANLMTRADLLSRAVELDPRFAVAWAFLGRDLAADYRFKGRSPARLRSAREAMERALALAPEDLEVRIAQGGYLANTIDVESAIKVLKSVLQIAPSHVEALNAITYVYNVARRYADGESALEKTLAVDPRNTMALTRLSGLLQGFRHFDRALALQRRRLDVQPDDLDLQARYHQIGAEKSGSWETYDQWRATIPADLAQASRRIWLNDMKRAAFRRDFDTLAWLAETMPERMRTPNQHWPEVVRAMTWLAARDVPRARAIASEVLAHSTAVLHDRPTEPGATRNAYFAHAILGNAGAALAAQKRAHSAAIAEKNLLDAAAFDQDLHRIQAILGHRELALKEISRQLKLPELLAADIRQDIACFSLWDDPTFKAIVDDPANNGPLPIENF